MKVYDCFCGIIQENPTIYFIVIGMISFILLAIRYYLYYLNTKNKKKL